MNKFKFVILIAFSLLAQCRDFFIVVEGNAEAGVTAIGVKPKCINTVVDSIIFTDSTGSIVFKYTPAILHDTLIGLSYIVLNGQISPFHNYTISIHSNKRLMRYNGLIFPDLQIE
jgi:hypothetical protein